MPEPKPIQSLLSEPVEPVFQALLNKIIPESYNYGLAKYETPLKSFNGRSELQDFAEEWVSAGRYVTQLAMRTHKLEELLIKAYGVLDAHHLSYAYGTQALMEQIREAIAQAYAEPK